MNKYKLKYENFGFLLKLKKMNPGILAKKMGVTRQTIYYWKTNGTSIDNIKIMAYYMGVDVEELKGEAIS